VVRVPTVRVIEELLVMLHPARFEQLAGSGPVVSGITPDLVHALGDELLGIGVRVLAIKLGERGLYLRTAPRRELSDLGRAMPRDPGRWADREFWAPCFRVSAVGTTGSGDATIAGFHAALLRGLGPEEAATMAVAVGACNVESPDTLSGLRTWEDTRKRIGAGWQRLPLELGEAGWRRGSGYELWER
jgi:sugar/nucleoside kinase (ribokinase family)